MSYWQEPSECQCKGCLVWAVLTVRSNSALRGCCGHASACCWSHTQHTSSPEGLMDGVRVTFCSFTPQTQAMKGLPLFRCWLFPHAVGGKSALGSLLTPPPGHKEGLLWEERTAAKCWATHWQSLEAGQPDASCPEPVLKEERRGSGVGQGLPPQAQCRVHASPP